MKPPPGLPKKKWLAPPMPAGGYGKLLRSGVARGWRVGVPVTVGVGVMLGVGVTDGVCVMVGLAVRVGEGVTVAVGVTAGAVAVGAAAVWVRRRATCEAMGTAVGVLGPHAAMTSASRHPDSHAARRRP
jgi:hypothetical protein